MVHQSTLVSIADSDEMPLSATFQLVFIVFQRTHLGFCIQSVKLVAKKKTDVYLCSCFIYQVSDKRSILGMLQKINTLKWLSFRNIYYT